MLDLNVELFYKIYTIATYLSLAGLAIFVILKAKNILSSRSEDRDEGEIIQNNTQEILKLDKSKLAGVLTVHYITIFSVTGFLLVFGFMGTQTLNNNIDIIPSLIISFLLGITGMVIFALVDYAIDLLTKFDVVFSANTVGLEAIVYEDIKARKAGTGKVRLTFNGKVAQFDAVTNNEVTLSKNTTVKIVNSLSDTCVVVEQA